MGFFGFDSGFESAYKQYRATINDYESLVNALSKMTTYLNDGHTNIELQYNNELCLNIPCNFFGDEVIVVRDYKSLRKGDIIKSINGISISEYFNIICTYIPHENVNLVKCRSTKYPYQNYHIFSHLNLKNILKTNGSFFNIGVLRNGIDYTYRLELVPYNGCLDFLQTNDFIKYKIFDEFALLILDECKDNEYYKETLNNFFKTVYDNNIGHIVLDLSENMGGSSSVTQEFIRYIDIDTFSFYDISTRKSNNGMINMLSRNHKIQNNKYERYLYKGLVSCIISNTTFSSAKFFATVLKDNSIAQLVGECSGGKPTSFGAPSKFETPNFKIRFRVSARLFKRPDSTKDDEECLFPDIYIPITINEYDRNLRIKKFINILKS